MDQNPELFKDYETSVERLKQSNERAIRETTNMVFESLVVEPSKQHAVLPEPIFKAEFLPYFSGEKSIAENKEVIPQWLQIAGSPSGEVDVIDQAGNVQFTVPAAFDLTVIEATHRKLGESMSDIYNMYQLHSNNSPKIGERVLAESFKNKIPSVIKASEILTTNQERWGKIFEHYGIGSKKDTSQAKQTSGDDDVEYE